MKDLPPSILMLPLLTALALYFPLPEGLPEAARQILPVSQHVSVGQQATTPSDHVTPAPDPRLAVPGEALHLLCEFFGLDMQKPNNACAAGDDCACTTNASGTAFKSPRLYHIEYLIATLPDPQDSPLAYLFDRHLDAVQRAIESTGYVLDRHSLPWKKQPEAPAHGRTTTSQPTTDQKRQGPAYTREPGVILFRQNYGSRDRLLVLFVVGETPTSGIHKTAFRNALEQIQQLSYRSASTSDDAAPIRVLGPTFSGSAVSLAMALRHWLDELTRTQQRRPQVQIISGSATAINKGAFLSLVGDCSNVTFNVTVRHEREARSAFLQYLVETGAVAVQAVQPDEQRSPRPTIAMLAETNTSYGQAIRGVQSEQDSDATVCRLWSVYRRCRQYHPSEVAEDTTMCRPPTSRQQIPVLSLTFPLHIAQLRAEAVKARPARSEMPNGIVALTRSLPLPLGEHDEAKERDVVPLFSTLETASTELVFSQMLSAIRREPIRYIGVFATDVRDRIFLIQELRRHVPNAVIFTLGADLLYLHAEANLALQGTLVITPYPLFSLNQLWSAPFDRRSHTQFSAHSAQGWYNATLAVLGRPELMIEYGQPFDLDTQGSLHRPQSWLSIVGRSDIWPVTILPATDLAEDTIPSGLIHLPEQLRAAQRQGARDSYTYPVLLPQPTVHGLTVSLSDASLVVGALLCIGLLCLLPSGVLFFHLVHLVRQKWCKACRPLKDSWLGRLYRVDEHGQHDRRVGLFACCVSLLLISLLTSMVALLPAWIKFDDKVHWAGNLLLDVVAMGMLATALLVLLILAIWLLFMRMPQPGHYPWARPLAIAASISSLGMCALACTALYQVVQYGQRAPSEAFFFFLRASALRSGVSPLLPLFFTGLGVFLVFFSVVRRLELAERSCHLSLDFATPSFSNLSTLADHIKGLLVCPIFCAVPGAWLSLVVLALPYWYDFIAQRVASLEGLAFDWFFNVAFYVVPLMLILMLLRLIWLAGALRTLLKRLGWHPLFQAPLDHNNATTSVLPKINLMSSTPTSTALISSIALAQHFFRLLNTTTGHNITIGWAASDVNQAERTLHEALAQERHGALPEVLALHHASQQTMCATTRAIAVWMEPHWAELNDPSASNYTLITQGRLCLISQVAVFLQYILAHLQSLAGLVTAGLLLMLMAATSYPFQPREPLLLFGWIGIGLVVAVTSVIFVQLSRDKVMSLLAGTTPDQVSWTSDLFLRIFIHGVLPILALLGAQFPEALRSLLSWFSLLQGKGP